MEIAPTLSEDGTALLFASNRSGAIRLWLSTRASVDEPFSKAVTLDEGSGSEFESLHPWLSRDASELYFTRQRNRYPTLWRTRRVPKDAPDQQQPLPSVRPEPIEWPSDAPPLAIAPFDDNQAKQHQHAWAEYLGVPEEKQVLLGNKDKNGLDIKLTLILIPPGEFLTLA